MSRRTLNNTMGLFALAALLLVLLACDTPPGGPPATPALPKSDATHGAIQLPPGEQFHSAFGNLYIVTVTPATPTQCRVFTIRSAISGYPRVVIKEGVKP